MQIQLNEAELEVAVTLYLTNQGMNLKNKSLELTFEGECTMDIEAIETDTPVEVEEEVSNDNSLFA